MLQARLKRHALDGTAPCDARLGEFDDRPEAPHNRAPRRCPTHQWAIRRLQARTRGRVRSAAAKPIVSPHWVRCRGATRRLGRAAPIPRPSWWPRPRAGAGSRDPGATRQSNEPEAHIDILTQTEPSTSSLGRQPGPGFSLNCPQLGLNTDKQRGLPSATRQRWRPSPKEAP